MNDEWKDAYRELNNKYVRECAAHQDTKAASQVERGLLIEDIRRLVVFQESAHGICRLLSDLDNVDPEKYRQLPQWLQDMLDNQPSYEAPAILERWGLPRG